MLWTIIVLYFVLMIGIGIICRKKTENVSDFVLGGRSLGPWLTAFAYGTSYFSAVVFIGYAGQFGWNYGLGASMIGIGNAVLGTLLPWLVLGKRTRLMTKQLESSTMPEFFGERFGDKRIKTASALIIFVFLIPYTASVYNGLSRLFESTLGISYSTCIIIMAVLTAIYVILGGYTATAVNDFIQGIIMLGGIIAVIICAIKYQGGMSSAVYKLSQISDTGIPKGSLVKLFGPDPLNLTGVLILTSLGTWGLPQMVQKFYAIKDGASVKRGAIISTLFAVVVAGGSYFLGSFGRLFVDKLSIGTNGKPVYDTIIPTLITSALPLILIGIVIVLVLSASMSTLASLVLTSSSTLTIDMIDPVFKISSEKKQVNIMRIFIGVFLLISVIIAMNPNAYISTLMSISWGALAGAFLGPYLWSLFSKKVTAAAVWTSFATGVLITSAHMIMFSLGLFPGLCETVASWGCRINLLSPVNCGAFVMLLSLVEVPLISAFTKKPAKEITDRAFECIEQKAE
jgi:SSS family solute:Na+ symporter